MATQEINSDNFQDICDNNDIVIVDFWASWCGPCMSFMPIYEKASESYSEIVFGKVDTEVEHELAAHFNIRSIPTLLVIRNGYEVFFQPGALYEEHLIELINKVKELDMGEVKKKFDEEDHPQDSDT